MIDKVISRIIADAEKRRRNAGLGGEWGDGGARALLEEVKFFNYGRNYEADKAIPPEWKFYEMEVDPEYEEFQRLKKKFGG